VIYKPELEYRYGGWTDVLSCLTQFQALTYLEMRIVPHANFHERPFDDDGKGFTAQRPLLSLRRLESLVMCTTHEFIASYMTLYNQMLHMATVATEHAELKHLSLPNQLTAIDAHRDLIRMHAPHLVSLRLPSYESGGDGSPTLDQWGPFPQLGYLYAAVILKGNHKSLFRACPNLQVLRTGSGAAHSLREVLKHASHLLPLLHTLHTSCPETSIHDDEQDMAEDEEEEEDSPSVSEAPATYFAVTPQLRHLYLDMGWIVGLDRPTVDALLSSLPHLDTLVMLRDKSGDKTILDHTTSWWDLSASDRDPTAMAHFSRLSVLQPIIESTDLFSLPLPSRLSNQTVIYVPRHFVESTDTINHEPYGVRKSMQHVLDAMNKYRSQFRLQRTDAQWETHIGQQLVAAGLSVLSPCGACQQDYAKRRMFDNSHPLDSHRAAAAMIRATRAASASASAQEEEE
jgi:hypothetical protein